MQLDDVIQTTSPDHARMKEAMERSIRWLDRCISAHKYPDRQNLFCIIQGGLDLEMRRQCCAEMVKRDTPGIAIGGLSGGEAKEDFCKVYVLTDYGCPSTADGCSTAVGPEYEVFLSVTNCLLIRVEQSRYVYGFVTGTETTICYGNSRSSKHIARVPFLSSSTALAMMEKIIRPSRRLDGAIMGL